MPSVLQLKKEELNTPEKRGKVTVSLVGCNRRAVFYALAFAEVGFKVVCTDVDQSIINRISKGNTNLGDQLAEKRLKSYLKKQLINVTSDLKTAISGSDIIIITTGTRSGAKSKIAYLEIENILKQIGAKLPKGCLVFYAGVSELGFFDDTIKETLENTSGLKVGEDFGLAYCPIYVSEWQETKVLDQELTLAANDASSLNSAAIVFETLTRKGIRKVQNVKIAELSVLLTAVRYELSIALANELSVFCEKAGLDYIETTKLIENIPCESITPTISEINNRDEAYLLLENAENLNVKLRLVALAKQINEEMIRHAITLTQGALRSGGKSLRRSKVILLGSGSPGTTNATFLDLLKVRGVNVSRYDLKIPEVELTNYGSSLRRTLNEAAEGADCIVILNGDNELERLNLKKLRAVMKTPASLVDLTGVIDPMKADKEGFIYRGLGRGAWKK